MGGGKAEGSKVDAGGKGQEAVVGAGKVAGGIGSDSEMFAQATPRDSPAHCGHGRWHPSSGLC